MPSKPFTEDRITFTPFHFQTRVAGEMCNNLRTHGVADCEAPQTYGKSFTGGMTAAQLHWHHECSKLRSMTIVTAATRMQEPRYLDEFGVSQKTPLRMSDTVAVAEFEKKLISGVRFAVYMTINGFYHAFGAMDKNANFATATPKEIKDGFVKNEETNKSERLILPPMLQLLLKHKVQRLLIVVDEHQFCYTARSLAMPSILCNLRVFGQTHDNFKANVALFSKGLNLDGTALKGRIMTAMHLIYKAEYIDDSNMTKEQIAEKRREVEEFRNSILSTPNEQDVQNISTKTAWLCDPFESKGEVDVVLKSTNNDMFLNMMHYYFSVGQLLHHIGTAPLEYDGLTKPVVVYKKMPNKERTDVHVLTPAKTRLLMNGVYAVADAVSFFDRNFLKNANMNLPFHPQSPKKVNMRLVTNIDNIREPKTVAIKHFHALLVIVATEPSEPCLNELRHVSGRVDANTCVFDFTKEKDSAIHHKIKVDVAPIFKKNKQMPVVIVLEKQVYGSNAFSFFTAAVLFGCQKTKGKMKYTQGQCFGRLARLGVAMNPKIDYVVPEHNGYECHHFCSDMTKYAAQDHNASDVKKAFSGHYKFGDGANINDFYELYKKLQGFDLGDRFLRNFFCVENKVVVPLQHSDQSSDFLAKKLLAAAKHCANNDDLWEATVEEYLRFMVSLCADPSHE